MNRLSILSPNSNTISFLEQDFENPSHNQCDLILIVGLAALGLLAAGYMYLNRCYKIRAKATQTERAEQILLPISHSRQENIRDKEQKRVLTCPLLSQSNAKIQQDVVLILEEFKNTIINLSEKHYIHFKPFQLSFFLVFDSAGNIQSISNFCQGLGNANDISCWIEFIDKTFKIQQQEIQHLPQCLQDHLYLLLIKLNQTMKEVEQKAQKVEDQREWIKKRMLKRSHGQVSQQNNEAVLNHCIEIVMQKPFWLNFFVSSKINLIK
jgi:hypothetical protein